MRRPLQGATRAALILAAALAASCGSRGGADRDGSAAPGRRRRALAGRTGHGDASLGDGAGRAGADGAGEPSVLADAAAPIAGTAVDTFDTESDFGFDPYHDTLQTNLGNPTSSTAASAPTLGFDSTKGARAPAR